MHPNIRKFFYYLAGFAGIAAAFAAGYLTRSFFPPGNEEFPVLSEAYRLVRDQGLKPLPDPRSLEYGMIRGLLEAYGDPYTVFIEPAQAELEGNSLQGSFGGIGVRIGEDADGYVVFFPYPDSPASQSGILEGDRLVAVDDLQVDRETPVEKIQAEVRGPVGETVTIVIARPPEYETYTFNVKRAEIPLPSVTWHLDPGEARLGVIEVNIIADSTPDEIERAVEDLQSRGATHFVLDLRNNGGGLLNSGVEVSRLFLESGEILQQQYRGREVETFDVSRAGPLAEIPLAVLVNQNTASAAEIIAGAIQAQDRAELIGSSTFGKNTIQLVFSLSDSSSIHITAANWWIPGIEFPKDGRGLTPDIPIPDGVTDPQAAVQEAIELFFHQPNGE